MRNRNVIFMLLVLVFTVIQTKAQVDNKFFGVALAGGEWGVFPTNSDLDYVASKGLRLVRMPISWERVQPTLNGSLVATELTKMKNFINYAKTKNIVVLIDLHNYCRRTMKIDGKDQLIIIGSAQLPVSAIKDFWAKIADEFKGTSNVWGYGLMNEPHDMQGNPMTWMNIAQALIDTIRVKDTNTPIVVGGDGWSGANGWLTTSNNLKNLKDPSGKIVFEAHCYWDIEGSSGSYSKSDALKTNPNRGIDRVKPFVTWLNTNKLKGFVGEYGIPKDDPAWALILDNFLKYLAANCVNGTYWAGGSFNCDYDIGITRCNGEDKSQMSTISKYLFTTGSCNDIPQGPQGYTWCAGDGESFNLIGLTDVAYGANGNFIYQSEKTGTITFNAATFGDPAPGVTKAGFYKKVVCDPITLLPTMQVNNGISVQTSAMIVAVGDHVTLDPQYSTAGTWTWTGPNGFKSSEPKISIQNIQKNQLGNYIASYTNKCSEKSTQNFTLALSGFAIPGKIQAESFNAMSGVQMETTLDVDGLQNVGWIETGDWMEYLIVVPVSGNYKIDYRVASLPGGGKLTISEDGLNLATTDIPNTTGWQVWTTISTTVPLTAGIRLIRLKATSGLWNINWWSTEKTVGIFSIEASSTSILIYPNPAHHMVNIRMSSTEPCDIRIYDIVGRMVWSKSGVKSDLAIPVREIGGMGIYFIQVGAQTQKLIIQ